MDERSSQDILAEAAARVRLRYARTRPARRAPPPLGQAASRLVRKAGGRYKLPPLKRLQQDWREIAGEAFWKVCRPEKLGNGRSGPRLTLRVLPAAAIMVQHQAESLRQRVSLAAGGKGIAEIALIQDPAFATTGTGVRARPARPLSATERAALEAAAQPIAHPGLRAAIVALGAAMLTAEDASAPSTGKAL